MENLKNITKNNILQLLDENLLFKNSAIFSDYNNLHLNFKKLLQQKNYIIFKNCHNITIEIQNDINRIELYKCSNIKIKVKKLIAGILLKKSNASILNANKIYNLEIEESEIIIPKNIYNNINYLSNTKSKIIFDN